MIQTYLETFPIYCTIFIQLHLKEVFFFLTFIQTLPCVGISPTAGVITTCLWGNVDMGWLLGNKVVSRGKIKFLMIQNHLEKLYNFLM